MKAIAKFLTVVTLIVLLTGGYIIWATTLDVVSAGGVIESAADRSGAFENIILSAKVGSDELTVFSSTLPDDPSQYVFATYTISIHNMNLLPAEWLELSITPQQDDVLLVNATVDDIPALSEQLVTVVLLTSRNSASYARYASLKYYVYGHEYTVPLLLTT